MRYFKGKIPVLFRGDSTLLDKISFWKGIARKFILRLIYKNIDIALYAGKANREYFLEMGVKKSKLVFMPHAIENERFATNAASIEQGRKLRASLQISETDLVFLFAGKLQSKKQPLELADAFISINNKSAHLIFVGSGELEPQLRKRCSNQSNIHFLGFVNQEQMPVVYECADVFVLPSKGPNETWGLSINEAMAAGKAVVASNACGATQDLIDHGINGFTFEKADMVALKKYLTFFADRKEAAKEMGCRSKEIIQSFSFSNNAAVLENIDIKFTIRK